MSDTAIPAVEPLDVIETTNSTGLCATINTEPTESSN